VSKPVLTEIELFEEPGIFVGSYSKGFVIYFCQKKKITLNRDFFTITNQVEIGKPFSGVDGFWSFAAARVYHSF